MESNQERIKNSLDSQGLGLTSCLSTLAYSKKDFNSEAKPLQNIALTALASFQTVADEVADSTRSKEIKGPRVTLGSLKDSCRNAMKYIWLWIFVFLFHIQWFEKDLVIPEGYNIACGPISTTDVRLAFPQIENLIFIFVWISSHLFALRNLCFTKLALFSYMRFCWRILEVVHESRH